MRIASWNSRAKYYVITEPGKKGIQARTDVGSPPPDDCELKGCTGDEWQRFVDDVETQRQIYENRELDKKKDSEPALDTSLKPKQNDELVKKENWFDSIFGS